MAKKVTERRRVSKEDVRANARASGGGRSWFKLPQGVREWQPEKAGSYLIDILPYEVKAANHPDKTDVGMLWYKYPFITFRNVGPNQENIISPASVGLPCPMMEALADLKKDYDANEAEIKALGMQRQVVYAIVDPDDKDRVAVFAMSKGKFGAVLDKEIEEGDDEILNFFQVTEDEGRTLKVRFSDEVFSGNKYLQANRIDFITRPAMDEDEVLAKVPCLDEIFNVMPYDKLKALFLQVETDDDAEDAGAGVTQPAAKAKAKPAPAATAAAARSSTTSGSQAGKPNVPAKGKPAPAAAASADETEPEYPVGSWVKFVVGGEEITAKVLEAMGDEYTVEDTAGDEHTVDVDDLEATEEPEPEPEPAPAPAPAPKGKAKAAPAATAATTTFKVGDHVADDAGTVGTITKIVKDDVTIKEDGTGNKVIVDIDDITISEEEPEPEPEAEDPEEPTTFLPGAKVTWDDGDAEGVVVKMHSSGTKVKVKDAAGVETWQPLEEVVAAAAPAPKGKRK